MGKYLHNIVVFRGFSLWKTMRWSVLEAGQQNPNSLLFFLPPQWRENFFPVFERAEMEKGKIKTLLFDQKSNSKTASQLPSFLHRSIENEKPSEFSFGAGFCFENVLKSLWTTTRNCNIEWLLLLALNISAWSDFHFVWCRMFVCCYFSNGRGKKHCSGGIKRTTDYDWTI